MGLRRIAYLLATLLSGFLLIPLEFGRDKEEGLNVSPGLAGRALHSRAA